MKITHDVSGRRFVLSDGEEEIGAIEYREGQGRINAIRTFVQPAYRKHGYATQLLDALVSYARSQNAKIVPVCSFTKEAFAQHPERYQDVM